MFGNQLVRTGSTDIDHQYRGEQVDPNTGFYNLRARWFNATNGRFLSMDSWSGRISDPTSLHRYLYASADPIDNLDPSGLETMEGLSAAEASGSILRGIRTTSTRIAINNAEGQAWETVVRGVIGKLEQRGLQFMGKQIRLTGPGGPRVLDFLVKIGDKLYKIEAKTRLPMNGGAFKRLVGQIFTYASPGEAEYAGDAIIVAIREAEYEAALARVLAAIESENLSLSVVQGTLELQATLEDLLASAGL